MVSKQGPVYGPSCVLSWITMKREYKFYLLSQSLGLLKAFCTIPILTSLGSIKPCVQNIS